MSNLTAGFNSTRRSLLGAIPMMFLLGACSKPPGKADALWAGFTDSKANIDHGTWDAMLQRHVRPDATGIYRVNYAAMKAQDQSALRGYLESLQAVPVQQFSRDEQFAFWVNLYNAGTVNVILEKYPVASIKDIGTLGQGPWGAKRFKVSGKDLSLDDIEHNILRAIWKDVRIHYAVNCASLGCPNLAARAWSGATNEAMLEAAAAAYVNHPRGFAEVDGLIVASGIYEWYRVDWQDVAGVLAHARKYARGDTARMLAAATTIDSYDYDWSLNDAA